MKQLLSAIVALLCVITVQAQAGRIIKVDNPKLTVFLPPTAIANGKAVMVCPGGAYGALAWDHEGTRWAPFFNERGLAVAVLEYTLPGGDYRKPQGDVEAAFKILADSAEVWNIKPAEIGIMGSSAGGHLASTMATHPTDVCRPAFQILLYPVISMQEGVTHYWSRRNLLGENPSPELVELFSNEKQVKPTTPPAFIALSGDDDVVAPENTFRYVTAMEKAGAPATVVIYPTGGHGWGYTPTFKYHAPMTAALTAWLSEL